MSSPRKIQKKGKKRRDSNAETLKNVANNLIVPCKYNSKGCSTSLELNKKYEHEKKCEFRPYNCPFVKAPCTWKGHLDEVMAHLEDSHASVHMYCDTKTLSVPIKMNVARTHSWTIQHMCSGHDFIMLLERQEQENGERFLASVHLIGTRKQAENFLYRLEIKNNRRRLFWVATPHCITHEGGLSAIPTLDCLQFDNSVVQNFSANNVVKISVAISQVS